MKSKVKASPDYAAAEHDGILLLVIIRNIMNNFDTHRNPVAAVHEMVQKFYTLKKGR